MRRVLFSLFLFVAVLMPNVGRAQYRFQTPMPEVTAAAASWQVNGEPIVVAGLIYNPTDARVFFDGNVMMQVGIYQGVPVYADATREPYTVLYVPVAGRMLRPYERPRNATPGEIEASWEPSIPVASPVTSPPEPAPRMIGTAGTVVPMAVGSGSASVTTQRPPRSIVQSIPRPQANNGIWVSHDGSRWYLAGPAVSYSAAMFSQAGQYRGFPVYRAINGRSDEIYIASVHGGPIAPYRKR